MTFIESIFPRNRLTPIGKVSINPEVDREIQRFIKQARLWFALRGRAVAGVFFDGDADLLNLKLTQNGHDFYAARINPRTLDFTIGPVQTGEIWLSLHYRWLRVDRIQWEADLLSVQCTGDWTTFINVKRSKTHQWHLWLPF